MRNDGWVGRRPGPTEAKILRLAVAAVGDRVLIADFIAPALASWQRNDTDAALEQLENAASQDDDEGLRVLALLLLADVLRACGRTEDALIALNSASRSSFEPTAPFASCVLGNIYEEYGDLGNAQLAYRRAAKSVDVTVSARARAHLAETMYFDGDLDGATSLLSEVVELGVQEWSGRAAGLLADIYFAEGRLDSARGFFSRTAVADVPDEGDRAVVMMAAILELDGDGVDARGPLEALSRSRDLPPKRRDFIEYVLGQHAGRIPGPEVDPAWAAYQRSAVDYYEAHFPPQG